eukprot:1945638-Rhodomonas_salina.1
MTHDPWMVSSFLNSIAVSLNPIRSSIREFTELGPRLPNTNTMQFLHERAAESQCMLTPQLNKHNYQVLERAFTSLAARDFQGRYTVLKTWLAGYEFGAKQHNLAVDIHSVRNHAIFRPMLLAMQVRPPRIEFVRTLSS